VREDESSAMAAGIDPTAVKLKAFMLSGALTALGGGIYGMFLSFIEPHIMFYLILSIQIALTAIIGGRGTIWGPAAGAVLLVGAGEIFRTTFAQANLLIYGILIVAVVLFLPRGLIGELSRRLMRRLYARSAQG
jgi:branched-chain amino acid transport system permease protein